MPSTILVRYVGSSPDIVPTRARPLGRYKSRMPIRLYEKEEQEYNDGWCRHTLHGNVVYDPCSDLLGRRGMQYRVLRFCETMKGFHTVCILHVVLVRCPDLTECRAS